MDHKPLFGTPALQKKSRPLEVIEQELEKAVAREDYEQAALLRDEAQRAYVEGIKANVLRQHRARQ